jgi:hypothetical protein
LSLPYIAFLIRSPVTYSLSSNLTRAKLVSLPRVGTVDGLVDQVKLSYCYVERWTDHLIKPTCSTGMLHCYQTPRSVSQFRCITSCRHSGLHSFIGNNRRVHDEPPALSTPFNIAKPSSFRICSAWRCSIANTMVVDA